jgi:peroxiredoxin
MLTSSRSWTAVLVLSLGITLAACQSKTTTAPPKQKSPEATREAKPATSPTHPAVKAAHKSVAQKPAPEQPAPPPTIAKVALSNELSATCLVRVGDTMPDADLPDVAGKVQSLAGLSGKKLTVVCLWSVGTTHRSQLTAQATLDDLMRDVAEPFKQKGVAVVAVDVGDAAAKVQSAVAEVGAAFPVLLDSQGKYLAKVAKDRRMPRIFLLDAGGRVLWFDLEWSRQSRVDLVQSIRAALGEL